MCLWFFGVAFEGDDEAVAELEALDALVLETAGAMFNNLRNRLDMFCFVVCDSFSWEAQRCSMSRMEYFGFK